MRTKKEVRRFEGTDIHFPEWLRNWGFRDRNKHEEGAATAIRPLPNDRVMIMVVYPSNRSERPRGVSKFRLDIADSANSADRLAIGAGGLPHVMGRLISYAIRKNREVLDKPSLLRKGMRIYNDANGAGEIVDLREYANGDRFCRVRWDLTGRVTPVLEGSCDLDLSQPGA